MKHSKFVYIVIGIVVSVVFTSFLLKEGKPFSKDNVSRNQHNHKTSTSVDYELNVDATKPLHKVSPTLYGDFFEEINHAGDGGIYGELISNRSFETLPSAADWTLTKTKASDGQMTWNTDVLLNSIQKHSLQLNVSKISANGRVGIANNGYWGIYLKKGEKYHLSFYAKGKGFNGPLTVTLESQDGSKIYAKDSIDTISDQWKEYKRTLTATGTSTNARLVLSTTKTGTIFFDVVSLFPKTWKNKSNGLRTDLAQKVADMHPGFLRFPGGCFVEGDKLVDAFKWKKTIGDISMRPGHWDIWQYQSTDGLGFLEYLEWAKELGAEPLYVVNVGISHSLGFKQIQTVPLDKINPWIQDVLDAIQYANGPVTSKWGAVRAKDGHPKPFNLKYIEIGNENNFQYAEYVKRYKLFYDAIKAHYPSIHLIADANVPGAPVDIVDEHYYSSPQWFMENANRYDTYSRKGPKIYVGEYAATKNVGKGNLYAALGEAAFMTGLERNSDIVSMASYAPLLVNVNDRFWTPDAIVFNNHQSFGTPSYYNQKIFAQNVGNVVLKTTLVNDQGKVKSHPISGGIGLGSWLTQVEYDNVKVVSNGKTIYNDTFSKGQSTNWHPQQGNWSIKDGVYKQSSTGTGETTTTGKSDWNNYTLTLKARKTAGAEGMLIMFGVKNSQNYYWWNIGGWGNTQSAIEKTVNGGKSTIGKSVPMKIKTNHWYNIKVEVMDDHIRCYLDGKLIHDVVDNRNPGPLFYDTTQNQKSGETFMKVVNTSDKNQSTTIHINGVNQVLPKGTVTTLTSDKLTDENSFASPKKVVPTTKQLNNLSKTFKYNFPKYSVTILKLSTK